MDKELFPEKGRDYEEIMDIIEEANERDVKFGSGHVFGSMCSEPLEITKKVHSMFIEANLGNPGLCRGTERLKNEVNRAISSLINAPDDCESLTIGGGTEGNILALWRARNETGNRRVILPKSAHFSFLKACDILEMEPVYLPSDENYLPDLELLEEMIDDSIAAVVGVAGTTELGLIEPIEEMADIVGDIHLHVDAAFGGLVIPFLKELGYEMPAYDFEIDGVDSLVLDPHKMGLSTIPLSIFYSREPLSFSVEAPYLSGERQRTLRGTRSSASISAFWATMNFLGREGYRQIIAQCMENTRYLLKELKSIGLEPIIEPLMNIASFHQDNAEKVVKEMERRGYNISRTVDPSGLRFVVMPHVNKENIDAMTKELSRVIG